MKFECEKTKLSDAVSAAALAVSAVNLPVEQNVRLLLKGDELTAVGNDNTVTIKAVISVGGVEDGVICMPARVITDVLKALVQNSKVQDVVVSDKLEDHKTKATEETKGSTLPVVISGGEAHFSINQIPVGEFNSLEIGTDAASAKFKTKDFLAALKQVASMAATSDRRPVLTGVLIENEGSGKSKSLRLVASDTFRLAIRDIEGLELPKTEQDSVLVPVSSLNKLVGLTGDDEEIVVSLEETQVSFEVGETTLTSQLLPGEFPDYRKLLPEDYHDKLLVNKEELMGALDCVSVIAREDTHQLVKAEFKADSIELSAVDKGKGSSVERIDAKFGGEDVSIGFNSKFLRDALKSLDDTELAASLNGATKPILIEGKKTTNFKCLLMPVRLSPEEGGG